MGRFSKERFQAFDNLSWRYYSWLTVLADADVRDIQDLQGQYLLKCPFHEDAVPSFRILLNEHYYHCFSCGAFGSVANLMWKLSDSDITQAQFYENLLKTNPQMQQELGFKSLFIDAKTLDPALASRRMFSPANSIGMQMPVVVLGEKVRTIENSWESLVYSLSLLQEGETTDNVYANVKRIFRSEDLDETKRPLEKVSLLSLLQEGDNYD